MDGGGRGRDDGEGVVRGAKEDDGTYETWGLCLIMYEITHNQRVSLCSHYCHIRVHLLYCSSVVSIVRVLASLYRRHLPLGAALGAV